MFARRQFHFKNSHPDNLLSDMNGRLKKKLEKPCEKDAEAKVISVTAKVHQKGTIQQLIDDIQNEPSNCCKHIYNIKHQYKAIRQLKEKLTATDVLIQTDFSENLSCKYMHSGASQRQISLHTDSQQYLSYTLYKLLISGPI